MKTNIRLLLSRFKRISLLKFSYFPIVTFVVISLLSGCSNQSTSDTDLRVTGFIENEAYLMSSGVKGIVTDILVKEGQQVNSGDALIEIDSELLLTQKVQAELLVEILTSNYNKLRSNPSETEIRKTEIEIGKAKAKLAQVETELELIKLAYSPYSPPTSDLHTAELTIKIAKEEINITERKLDQINAGTHPSQIKISELKINEAEIQKEIVTYLLSQHTLRTNHAGLVKDILINRGEYALPGQPLIKIINPNAFKLSIYVSEEVRLGLNVGDKLRITVNSYPGEVYSGTIKEISSEAVFTPSAVITEEERVKLVFEVILSITSPPGKLHAGMPADVWLE